MSCRVLLAAHRSSTLWVLARLLRLSGHEVTLAEDGTAALALACAAAYDCALIDIGAPDDSGVHLLSNLAKLHVGGVAFSGNAEPEYAAACRQAGFVHVLKPIEYSTLLGVLENRAASRDVVMG